MTVVSLLTPSFVARQTGYALTGDWMAGGLGTRMPCTDRRRKTIPLARIIVL